MPEKCKLWEIGTSSRQYGLKSIKIDYKKKLEQQIYMELPEIRFFQLLTCTRIQDLQTVIQTCCMLAFNLEKKNHQLIFKPFYSVELLDIRFVLRLLITASYEKIVNTEC